MCVCVFLTSFYRIRMGLNGINHAVVDGIGSLDTPSRNSNIPMTAMGPKLEVPTNKETQNWSFQIVTWTALGGIQLILGADLAISIEACILEESSIIGSCEFTRFHACKNGVRCCGKSWWEKSHGTPWVWGMWVGEMAPLKKIAHVDSHTVDGKNPAPVYFSPLFTGF